MKTILILVTLGLVPTFLQAEQPCCTSCDSVAINESEFRQLVEYWRLAYNTNDSTSLASMYSEDAEYISSHIAGLVARGRDAVIANHQKGMNLGGHLDSVDILSMRSSGSLVVLVCQYRATNAGEKANGRTLLVLKKTGDRWLITTHMTVV